MEIKSPKASTPIVFVFVASLGIGVAYGVVKAFNLSLVAQILSFIVIGLIMWLIFRQGKAASYSSAQAWANSVANAHADAYATAKAKAEALSEAYAMAISQANATASNIVNLQLPSNLSAIIPVLSESNTQSIEHSNLYSDEVNDERPDVLSPSLATRYDRGEIQLNPQES